MQVFRIEEANAELVPAQNTDQSYGQQQSESFNSCEAGYPHEGVPQDGCNLEWVDCFDEVLNALNGLPVDIPGALQVHNCYISCLYFLFCL